MEGRVYNFMLYTFIIMAYSIHSSCTLLIILKGGGGLVVSESLSGILLRFCIKAGLEVAVKEINHVDVDIHIMGRYYEFNPIQGGGSEITLFREVG